MRHSATSGITTAQDAPTQCVRYEMKTPTRVEKDTLLVDVTSLDQGGRYHCNADLLPVREAAITREVAVAG